MAHGDVDGLIATELRRLQAPPQTPPGWKNHYSFGEGGIFSLCGPAEMCCQTRNNVAILQRDVMHKLQPGLQLGWRCCSK